ncbi:DnaJ C-terminal domain-containing protein [Aurantiacibacter poecillastricola]|uniref:DnaJ C-terminal domain-containing protein n=1 Tax=Aurantiacibacter poecillastricola TaxID=3064385 RepID=UPI00273EE015|nr:DnaJ C-terminal domain-containing protein [Aurantiacibacter sp. 219JJ12-13]MDP5260454.1 DnaJ C-terminal domain-containing protein [Aurantiacibacter sp. 219JJ12-13]
MADPYSTLGVSRSASEADIKSAYRKLAKELHPDRNKDNPQAADRFGKVTQAYDLLSDKDKRARFDRGEIDADGNPTSPFGMGGGYGGGGFGGARPGGRSGAGGYSSRDFQGFGGGGGEEVDLGDLFEGLFGRSAPGNGMGGGSRGFRRQPPPSQKGADVRYKLAVPFVDAATRAKQRITLSDGKTIDLSLPAGVEDGTTMRLKGKGQKGPGGNGDGIVVIDIQPHPFFTRDGDDVRVELPITLDEAINGAKVKVPTVDGPVMLTIGAGSSGGKTLRMKGKGFSRKDGSRGDQLLMLEIHLPDDVTELKDKLDGWRDTANPRSHMGL